MNKYIASTVCAGILWGVISLFLRPLSLFGFSSLQIMFFRAVLSSIFMLIFLLVKDKSLLKINLRDLWMFIGTGVISLTFFSLCYFTTILNVGTSIAVVLLYTSPIFVLFMSIFLFKEKLTGAKIVSVILTFGGCILVSGFLGSDISKLSFRNFLIGIGAGFGYALYSIFSRYALKKYSALTVTFYTFVFSGISLIPIANIAQIPSVITVKSSLFAICIALFCTVLPYILYTFGLKGLQTSQAALIVTVEPFVGTIVGLTVWKEQLSFLCILGILMILIGVICSGLPSKK